MGGITDTLSLFAEEQVSPKILEMFQQRGIDLQETHSNVRVTKTGNFYWKLIFSWSISFMPSWWR